MDLTDSTITEAENKFEAMLTEEENPTPQEQPEETLEAAPEEVEEETTEDAELEATNEEAEEEVSEPESDDFGQWLGDVQDSLQDNPELLDTLKLKIKVNGEDQEVSFADLKKSQMQEADYTRKTQALAEQRKANEAAIATAKQEHDKQVQELAAVTNSLESELTAEYQGINWEELRQYDPAEWGAKREEFRVKHAKIQQAKQQAINQIQTVRQQEVATQTQEALKVLTQEIPEWTDQNAMQAELGRIREAALTTYNMRPSSVENVTDPGLILMARDAMKYRQSKNVLKSKAKVLKTVPKFTKPGAKQAANASVTGKQTKAINLLKNTGRVKDAAKMFEQFL